VFAGKLDISGQQPLHCTVHFHLHDRDPCNCRRMAMQDIQHGQAFGMSLGETRIEFHDCRTFLKVFSVADIKLRYQLFYEVFDRCCHNDPQSEKRHEGQQKSQPTGRVNDEGLGFVGGPDEGQAWTYNEVSSDAGTAYVAHIRNNSASTPASFGMTMPIPKPLSLST
jgi:hypothetical protein